MKLIEAGTDPNPAAFDRVGRTVASCLARRGRIEYVNLLPDAFQTVTESKAAVANESAENDETESPAGAKSLIAISTDGAAWFQ